MKPGHPPCAAPALLLTAPADPHPGETIQQITTENGACKVVYTTSDWDTGFTATVKRSETIDLNITMEQALQYIMSCGVVTPPQQGYKATSFRQLPAAPPLPAPSPDT